MPGGVANLGHGFAVCIVPVQLLEGKRFIFISESSGVSVPETPPNDCHCWMERSAFDPRCGVQRTDMLGRYVAYTRNNLQQLVIYERHFRSLVGLVELTVDVDGCLCSIHSSPDTLSLAGAV